VLTRSPPLLLLLPRRSFVSFGLWSVHTLLTLCQVRLATHVTVRWPLLPPPHCSTHTQPSAVMLRHAQAA
jgi:hypothetical protein